jgi:hypothetical protein
MTVVASILLAGLRRRGFRLDACAREQSWVLGVEPASALTDADRAHIGTHREALLDLLYAEQPDDGQPPVPFLWYDDAPPAREEWDEETQQWVTVGGRRPVNRGIVPGPTVIDPPPPPPGESVEFPPGAALFWQDRRGRPCKPPLAVRWCWAGGDRWYDPRTNPPRGVPVLDRSDEAQGDDHA